MPDAFAAPVADCLRLPPMPAAATDAAIFAADAATPLHFDEVRAITPMPPLPLPPTMPRHA